MSYTPQPHLSPTEEYVLFRGSMGDSTVKLLTPKAKKSGIEVTLNDLGKPPYNVPVMDIFDRSVHAALDKLDAEHAPSPLVKREVFGLIATQLESLLHAASHADTDLESQVHPEDAPRLNAASLNNICHDLPLYYAVPNGSFYQELKLLTPFYQAIHDPITLKSPVILPAKYGVTRLTDHGKDLLREAALATDTPIDDEELEAWTLADHVAAQGVSLHPMVEVRKLQGRLIRTLGDHATEFFSLAPESDQSEAALASRDIASQKATEIIKFSDLLLARERSQMKGDKLYDQEHYLTPVASAKFLLEAMMLARYSPDVESLKEAFSPKSDWFKDHYRELKAHSGSKHDRTPRTVVGRIHHASTTLEVPSEPGIITRQ